MIRREDGRVLAIASFNSAKGVKPYEWQGWELTYVGAPIEPWVDRGDVLLELIDGAWCCGKDKPIVVTGHAS